MAEHVLRKALMAGGALLAFGAFSAPASAQFYGSWGPRVYRERPYYIERPFVDEREAPLDVRAMLIEDGYQVRGRIQRKGPVYLADVIDLRGRAARLVIDAEDGTILERFANSDIPRPPRDIASAAPARRSVDEAPMPEVFRGPGAERRSIAPQAAKPMVASREPMKPAAPVKPKAVPDKKPLASEALRPPTPKPAAEAPAQPTKPVAQTQPPKTPPRVIAPELTGPPPGVQQPAPAQAPRNESGFANGVPVNPLD